MDKCNTCNGILSKYEFEECVGCRLVALRRESAALLSRAEKAEEERDKLREALAEIAKGAGRYSHDPLTHADNCIDDMKALAVAALRGDEPRRTDDELNAIAEKIRRT